MAPGATLVPSVFFFRLSPLIAVIVRPSSEEVRRYTTHSPLRTGKSVEDVLRNLNLSSAITPQMINLGLSQERT